MDITPERVEEGGAPWLFFMFRLPARRGSQRVSVWRKLQKYGALAWKNSAYVLPRSPASVEKFQWLAAEVRKYRGEASVVEVVRIEGQPDRKVISFFNEARARDYDLLIRDLRVALRAAAGSTRGANAGALASLNRRYSEVAAVDFFGCGRRREAEALLKELGEAGRNGAGGGSSRPTKAHAFHGRLWMTRPRPQVDRVSSSWLIKHFIDPKARFVFAADPEAHPGAVRFDMFEGEFTHVGNDCTFETLLKRFGIRDRRLRLIGEIVHDADLEDNRFGRREGRALDLVFKGWGKMDWPDAEILRRGFDVLDALYLTLGT